MVQKVTQNIVLGGYIWRMWKKILLTRAPGNFGIRYNQEKERKKWGRKMLKLGQY